MNLKLMKTTICILLLILASCTREIESYTTRLEIQNNLNNQVDCIIYPKSGIYLSCDTFSKINQNGAFVAIYAVGAMKNPAQLFASIADSIHIIYTNPPDSTKHFLLFSPPVVKNYMNNPFKDDRAWTITNTVTNHYTPTSNMH